MTDQPPVDPDLPQVPASVGELTELVDEMILYVQQARAVPLSGSAMVDRGEFLDMLQRLRTELPEELRAARWMVRERETFIAKTNERAAEIMRRAKEHAAQMVTETQVMNEAVEEANHLVRNAEGEAMRLRLEAEDLTEATFERLDHMLTGLLEEVRIHRRELHESRPPPPDVPLSE